VIVLNWNSVWYSRRCLRSLLATEYPGSSLEIVLVDNGSIDGSGLILAREFPDVRHLRLESNLGFAEGCNRALRERSGVDYVALINNDVVVGSDWLRPLVEALESDPSAGAAAAQMVLEPPTAEVVLRAPAGVTLERVEVDGVDVTRRIVSSGLRAEADLAWPLDVRRHIEGVARIMVPAGPRSDVVTITCAGHGSVAVSTDRPAEVQFESPGSCSVELGWDRIELLNGLGTRLNELREGVDCGFGRPIDAGVPDDPADGFCGGGVLLRSSMLDEVGLFDPRFFAYYEDTDLSWRARSLGWHTVVVPDSKVWHAFGAAGGSRSPAFWFLDRRNWILTTLRNGDRRDRSTVLSAAREATWRSVRANLIGRIRRGWRPRWRLTGTWIRVWVSVCSWIIAGSATRSGSDIGREDLDRVRSRLQPRTAPVPPTRRPGGPQLVYLDVSDTLRSGWRAGIQRVVVGLARELGAADPDLDLILVVWSDAHDRFRRATTDEVRSLLGPVLPLRPGRAGHSGVVVRSRLVVGAALRRLGLRSAVRRVERRLAAARTPRIERDLLLDHLEPGSILLELDAVWNRAEPDRRTLYGSLCAAGVRVVPFVHDLLPLEHPEWFVPELVEVFTETVAAQLEAADDVIVASSVTARAVHSAVRRLDTSQPSVHEVRLASDLEDRVPGQLVPELPQVRGSRYVLMVGTVEPRKNQLTVLAALDELDGSDDVEDLVLVIVGREGWRASEVASQLRRRALGRSVVWIEDADDLQLEALYAGARLLLAPSLAEGFGLPVAEALRHGVPVVASPMGAPGVDPALIARFVDPADTAGWSRAIRELAGDTPARSVALRAIDGAACASWRDVATDVADVLLGRRRSA